MWKLSACYLFSTAVLINYTLAVLTLNIVRGPQYNQGVDTQRIKGRATITATLNNNVTGGAYYVEVDVGTPAQRQRLVVDTGSSDTWILDSKADLCTVPRIQESSFGGCETTYDPSKSSTVAVAVANAFNITYLDETGASGDYITDTLAIGGATIPALQMGLAHESTIGSGLMGVGYSENVASHSRYNIVPSFIYPNIIDKMLSSNVISRKAYSLYLNDLSASTGSIIFGGMDTAKYHGSLLELPVVPSKYPNGTAVFAELSVVMTSVGITGQQGNVVNFTTAGYKGSALLDSGTTFTYLQPKVVESIYQGLNVIDDTDQTGVPLIDCAILVNSPKLTVDYGFGGANGMVLHVPIDELVFDLARFNLTEDDLPETGFKSTCGFGIFTSDDEDSSLLGDTFLRSAYVVYDLESNQIAIGQTNFNSTTSNVIEFTANAKDIPDVSGVATSAEITQTSIGGLPGVGTKPTANPTTTGSGSSATTTVPAATSSSAAAAASAIPALGNASFALLGSCLAFVAMGGGLFIL